MEISKFINKAKYNKESQKIWGVQDNGHHQMICDLRGWGAIQNLFIDKKGKIDLEKASEYQDELGEWIVDAINQKLNNNA